MDLDRLAERLDAAFSTPLQLPEAEGVVHIADEVPDLEALLEEATETEAERAALHDNGWYFASEVMGLQEVLSFEYIGSPAGGTLAWWLLETGDGRRYAVYQMDDRGAVVFARLDGDPEALFGPVVERFLSTNGEAFGVGDNLMALPGLIHNRAPEVVPEASVRAGARVLVDYAAREWGIGWDQLSGAHPDPQTVEEKEAAFAAYWTRAYTEAENPYQR